MRALDQLQTEQLNEWDREQCLIIIIIIHCLAVAMKFKRNFPIAFLIPIRIGCFAVCASNALYGTIESVRMTNNRMNLRTLNTLLIKMA